MARFLSRVLVALFASLGLCSCESWLLGEEESGGGLSVLTQDVAFMATSVTAQHTTDKTIDDKPRENFFLEFVGEDRAGFKDVVMLDLLAPEGTQSLVGEYVVGYEGDYVALSRYDILDQPTGMIYTGGCMYAEAKNNYLTGYFGYLTKGSVTISLLEDDTYLVKVNAYSVHHTIKMTYSGKIELKAES